MTKINQEEYEILKGLDDKWKWIARDGENLMYGGELQTYTEMPQKRANVMWSNGWGSEKLSVGGLFQFIKWEDEEPYNIAELIREYEKHEFVKINHEGQERLNKLFGNESEEKEMKTLESIREEIWEEMLRLEDKRKDQWADIKYQTLREVLQKLGHLDEPEVLWQELPVIPKFVADWYESEGKRTSWWNWFYKWGRDEHRTDLETKTIRWMQDFNEELFVDIFRYGYEVEEEQKYNVKFKVKSSFGTVGIFLYKKGDEVLAGDNFRAYYPKEEEYMLTEQEIRGFQNGDVLFEHFAKPVEELEE